MEFFDPLFIGRDRRALYPDAIFLDRVGRIDGDLVVGLVALFNRQIIVFQIDVEIGQNEPLADPLPDDAGHFVAVEFNDRVFHLDLRHVGALAFQYGRVGRPGFAVRRKAWGKAGVFEPP